MGLQRSTILADTARILEVPADQLDPSVSLVDQGLDSVRLIALVEQWRETGVDVDFVALSTQPELDHWFAVLGAN
ncbi:phosphopantetheine-binding protein [Hoyosella subflava]|uniref:Isochorismatase transposase n=1 Tax=Hoyosella subflava (strain DSM 45089 / JCM 17490 / NBRC 109087 / DQS3-9A1) TaxID=443218 RepID=F6EEE9_HOYSD|nr:phosphopantetheine-binding protein [Hoyosella subflava]AEF38601.1 Isochorismatase transposase [Hoyosella subflava DQS3-9A1]